MEDKEKESDRIISGYNYFVACVKSEEHNFLDSARKIYTSFYNDGIEIICSYIYNNSMFLIFNNKEEPEEHYLSGSHHGLISYIVSKICLEISEKVDCNIVEFCTQIEVLTYFSTRILSNIKDSIYIHGKGLISKTDIKNKTREELLLLFPAEESWDNLDPKKKYGQFLKIQKDCKDRVFKIMCEEIDSRYTKKYLKFMFC